MKIQPSIENSLLPGLLQPQYGSYSPLKHEAHESAFCTQIKTTRDKIIIWCMVIVFENMSSHVGFTYPV